MRLLLLKSFSVVFILSIIMSSSAFAQKPQVTILSVSVDFDSELLTITGENFDIGPDPTTVSLSGINLDIISNDGSTIIVALPENLPPGDYELLVKSGPGKRKMDNESLTIGNQGPQGDIGPVGISCWDLNENGIRDPEEDLNRDGFVDVDDCAGEDGARGPTGAQGPQGPQGPAGADGIPGPQGPQGSQGPAGLPGPAGAQGDQGPAGPPGPAGADGSPGPQGEPGPAGADGTDGTDGIDGTDGVDGTDGMDGADGADGVACWDLNEDGMCTDLDGSPGDEDINNDNNCDVLDCIGPQGPQGADGTPGADGADGSDGADGADGSDGADGADGADGMDGVDGADGADGADGTDGIDGTDGVDGADGADGTDGTDGVSGYEIVFESVNIIEFLGGQTTSLPFGTVISGTASCPNTKVVLGGGCEGVDIDRFADGTFEALSITDSYPINTQTWFCQVKHNIFFNPANPGPLFVGSNSAVRIWAICADISP